MARPPTLYRTDCGRTGERLCGWFDPDALSPLTSFAAMRRVERGVVGRVDELEDHSAGRRSRTFGAGPEACRIFMFTLQRRSISPALLAGVDGEREGRCLRRPETDLRNEARRVARAEPNARARRLGTSSGLHPRASHIHACAAAAIAALVAVVSRCARPGEAHARGRMGESALSG